MVNRLRGEAVFAHDGEDLTLVFDAESLLQVEDLTGFGLLSLTEGLGRLRVLATMLIVGVQRGCGREFSMDEAVDMLAYNPAARDAIVLALDRALPDAEPREGGATASGPLASAAGKRGAGKNS